MKTPRFSVAALECVQETGIDPQQDIADLERGFHSEESLLRECLKNCDDDRIAGWRQYVAAVVAAADMPKPQPSRSCAGLSGGCQGCAVERSSGAVGVHQPVAS